MTSAKAPNGVQNTTRTEREVQGLRGEVPDNVGSVTTPERDKALITVRAGEAINDALVRRGETTLFDLQRFPCVRKT